MFRYVSSWRCLWTLSLQATGTALSLRSSTDPVPHRSGRALRSVPEEPVSVWRRELGSRRRRGQSVQSWAVQAPRGGDETRPLALLIRQNNHVLNVWMCEKYTEGFSASVFRTVSSTNDLHMFSFIVLKNEFMLKKRSNINNCAQKNLL